MRLGPTLPQSVTWTIDPDHSAATFTVRHMLVANVRGEFAGPTGTVSYDPKNIAGTLKVEATLDARTINTRIATRISRANGSSPWISTRPSGSHRNGRKPAPVVICWSPATS
jgi:hypothetical protein